MCPMSASSPSDTSIAADAIPRSFRPSATRGEVESAGRAAGVAVTRIGCIVAGPAEVRVLAGGKPVESVRRGFDHFQ